MATEAPESLIPQVPEDSVMQSNYGFADPPKLFGPPVVKTKNPYPIDWGSLGQIPPPPPGMVKAIDGVLYKVEETWRTERGVEARPEVLKRKKAEADAEQERLAKLPVVVPTPPPPLTEYGFLNLDDSKAVRTKIVGDWLANPPGSMSGKSAYFLLPLAADTELGKLIDSEDAYEHPQLGKCLVLHAGQSFEYGPDGVGRYKPAMLLRCEIEVVVGLTRRLENWRRFNEDKKAAGWITFQQRREGEREAVAK